MSQRLTAPELDFLWESFGAGELPYPLTARSHGETMEQRAVLRQQVMAALQERGLVDGRGRAEPVIEEAFEVLAAPDVSFDSIQVGEPGGDSQQAFAGAIGTNGLLAVQDADGLRLERVPADGLATAIVGLLPAQRRGSEKSISMPLDQLMAGHGADFLQRRVPDGNGGSSIDEDRKALARLHAQPRLRGGQLCANARSRSGGKQRMPVLSWFDTETGRYLTQASRGADGRDWITIAPTDAPALRHRLYEMLASAAHAAEVPLR